MSRSIARFRSVLGVLAEMSLAALSFLFFKTVKYLFRPVLSLYYIIAKRQAYQWKFASAELLETPGALLMIMTTGPRWNTHAIIGTAGPLEVKQSLTVNVAAAQHAAPVWTLVVCTFPDYRPVARIGSLNAPFNGPSVEIPLHPGKYWLALRYYHWTQDVQLPELVVDGSVVIPAKPVRRDVNDFYQTLAVKTNRFYIWLDYYVFVMLRYQRYLPSSFVKSEIVPLGNPETIFRFGALPAGNRLSIQTVPKVLDAYDIYITTYNRASFPLSSYHVTDPEFVSPTSGGNLIYLARIHQKGLVGEEFPSDLLKISVLSGQPEPLERSAVGRQ